MKKLLSKLYLLLLMAFTVFMMVVIWDVTLGKLVAEFRHRKLSQQATEIKAGKKEASETTTFKQAILEGEKRVKHYLGYRVLEQRWLKGHFHHIDFDFKPDKHNYCINCHGDMPHDKVKELRAFGNMHASFIGCQTCHVRLEGSARTGVFKWYDRTTGEIVDSPVEKGTQAGAYNAKIIPFERIDGRLQRVDTPERVAFARDYRKNEKTLTDIQKSKAKKIIHKIVSKKPYLCGDCHRKEGSMLPFKELGYPQERINVIVSTEVVGMIHKYTEFYMPRILHPGESEKK